MKHVFLSHSSKDHEVTSGFYHDLIKLGFRVWYDEVEMEPGDSLIEKIGSALRSSMNLAVLLSANSVDSRWVKKEVSLALVGKLAGSDVNVVPIRLDDSELPYFLTDVKYVDWRDDSKKQLEFARLVKMLLSSEGRAGALLRLVSDTAYDSSSHQYDHRFGPSHVLSFSPEIDKASPSTYWLTPDETPATISLKLARAYPVRLLRIVNTQNRHVHDRGTRLASISFATAEGAKFNVWKGAIPPHPMWLNLWFDSVYADTVHVHVEKWVGKGGGLNCIEVYAED